MTKPLRIVIAEDDGIIAMDLAELLTGMGHEVCAIASTPADVVAKARQFSPDLMIVDGKLGNGSGVAAMLSVLQSGDVAHFYVTGNEWTVRELAPDAIVITKPFTLRELTRGITAACAAVHQRQNSR